MSHRVTIIGGGITGLTCAFKLSQSKEFAAGNLHITLLESLPRFGGVIETIHTDGCIIDCGPDSFITNKPFMLDLARQLGIEERIIEVNAQHRGALIVNRGKLVPLPVGFVMLAPANLRAFFASPILSLAGKLRASFDLFLPRRRGVREESLAAFVRRRFGQEVLDRLAQPMVAGIYVGDADCLSADYTAARFVEMERTAGSVIKALRHQQMSKSTAANLDADFDSQSSGARYGLFASFDQGMAVIVDALIAALDKPNIDLRLDARVLSISHKSQAYGVTLTDSQTGSSEIDADQLVITTSAKMAGSLLESVNAPLSMALGKIPAASSAVATFIFERGQFDHALDAFGAVVPEVEMTKYKINSLAFSFASVKFPRAPEGKVVIRAFLGGIKKTHLLAGDDQQLIDMALADLRLLLGLKGLPQYQALHRWVDSMPQYQLGHQNLIKEIEAALAGSTLHLGGAYFSGVGLPDCVANGSDCALSVLKTLGASCKLSN